LRVPNRVCWTRWPGWPDHQNTGAGSAVASASGTDAELPTHPHRVSDIALLTGGDIANVTPAGKRVSR